jgi:exosortase D (VPLPA-CTERM-specific)
VVNEVASPAASGLPGQQAGHGASTPSAAGTHAAGTAHATANWIPWLALLAGSVALGLAFAPSLALVWDAWLESEEYSHGILMPIVGAYLAWQRWPTLRALPVAGSPWGIPAIVLGVAAAAMGVLASTQALTQYACLLTLAALLLATHGRAWLLAMRFQLLLLALAIPLPAFFYNALSLQLQLWSSDLGVLVIRLLGITVFQDGNVIDLGALQLEVAEACNGLRYLFPMIALAVIMAYIYSAPMWRRVLLVLAALPVAVCMNGLRIGVIGYLVEHHGPSVAEGFVHSLQGWMMFMLSFGILLALVLLLEWVSGGRRALSQVLVLVDDSDGNRIADAGHVRARHGIAVAAAVVLVTTSGAAWVAPAREEVVPDRDALMTFPMQLAQWQGESRRIEGQFLRTLRLTDYLLADYLLADPARADAASATSRVNLYVAWYDSQRQGQAAHSPRSCLPGDGWQIDSLDVLHLASVGPVNRALIRKGDDAQLVYYWFAQRGRVIANEYAVKWWMVVDSVLRNRTDGALVRLTTTLAPGEPADAGDRRLRDFVTLAHDPLARHLPD